MRLSPPQQRAATRFELAKVKGLGQVVVSADIQRTDAILDIGPRRKHQRRCVVATVAYAVQDGEAIHAGKLDIQHQKIVALVFEQAASAQSVRFAIHAMATAAKAAGNGVGKIEVIFDEKDAHVAPCNRPAMHRRLFEAAQAICSLRWFNSLIMNRWYSKWPATKERDY